MSWLKTFCNTCMGMDRVNTVMDGWMDAQKAFSEKAKKMRIKTENILLQIESLKL